MTKLSRIMATSLQLKSLPSNGGVGGQKVGTFGQFIADNNFPAFSDGASWISPFIAQVDDGAFSARRASVPV